MPRQESWNQWLARLAEGDPRYFTSCHPLLQGSPGAVPVLLDLLADPNAEVRVFAAEGLGRVGGKAKGALPALFRAVQDPDDDVRREAEDALFRIDWGAARRAGLGKGRWWSGR